MTSVVEDLSAVEPDREVGPIYGPNPFVQPDRKFMAILQEIDAIIDCDWKAARKDYESECFHIGHPFEGLARLALLTGIKEQDEEDFVFEHDCGVSIQISLDEDYRLVKTHLDA